MQTESRASSLLERFAEVQLIFCKDSHSYRKTQFARNKKRKILLFNMKTPFALLTVFLQENGKNM